MSETGSSVLSEAVRQIPSLVVLVFLVVFFLRALDKQYDRFSASLDQIDKSLQEDRRLRSELGGKVLTRIEETHRDILVGQGCRFRGVGYFVSKPGLDPSETAPEG